MTERRWYLLEAWKYVEAVVGDRNEAFFQLCGAFRRGEIVAVAETWGPRDRWRALALGNKELTLPKEAWEHIQIQEDGLAYWPRRWPRPGQVVEEGDDDYGHGVHVSRAAIESLWTPNERVRYSYDTSNNQYITPFIGMMIKAINHFEINEDKCDVKKEELVEFFLSCPLPDGSRLSPNQANMMATFSRPPRFMKGGNKRVGR